MFSVMHQDYKITFLVKMIQEKALYSVVILWLNHYSQVLIIENLLILLSSDVSLYHDTFGMMPVLILL